MIICLLKMTNIFKLIYNYIKRTIYLEHTAILVAVFFYVLFPTSKPTTIYKTEAATVTHSSIQPHERTRILSNVIIDNNIVAFMCN